MSHYVLGEHHAVVVEPDLMKWAAWMTAARFSRAFIVRKTNVHGLEVSTVFLGLDYGFGESKVPVVFETMVFTSHGKGRSGGEVAFSGGTEHIFGVMRRYCTWHEALAGHEQAVAGFRQRFEVAKSKGGNVRFNRRRHARLEEVFNGRVRATKPA